MQCWLEQCTLLCMHALLKHSQGAHLLALFLPGLLAAAALLGALCRLLGLLLLPQQLLCRLPSSLCCPCGFDSSSFCSGRGFISRGLQSSHCCLGSDESNLTSACWAPAVLVCNFEIKRRP